jgi:transcriptional regulator with XRE-family HTH domain
MEMGINVLKQTVAWQDFGPFLRKLRQRRGISQENLALMLGCHRTYIWRLEHGRNRPSRIFLHNLKLTCHLAPAEITLFTLFEQLR